MGPSGGICANYQLNGHAIQLISDHRFLSLAMTRQRPAAQGKQRASSTCLQHGIDPLSILGFPKIGDPDIVP